MHGNVSCTVSYLPGLSSNIPTQRTSAKLYRGEEKIAVPYCAPDYWSNQNESVMEHVEDREVWTYDGRDGGLTFVHRQLTNAK